MEKKLLKVSEKFLLLCILVLVAGCVSTKPGAIKAEKPKNESVILNKEVEESKPVAPAPTSPPLDTAVPSPATTPPPIQAAPGASDGKNVPRIGLIFSAGGAKTFGHIGVLKEIEKAKWPIRGVGGLEWGAAIAGIYAHQLSANEVEWEMSKIKRFDDLDENAQNLFANRSVAELKVPFVCPSINISKQEAYLLNRGQLAKLIPFCAAHPPLSKMYNQSVANLDAISEVAQHLRATGVRRIVLINVLMQKTKKNLVSDTDSGENILYVKAAVEANRKPAGVDDMIQVNLEDFDISDLGDKREIIAKAAELSYDQIVKLTRKYGL